MKKASEFYDEELDKRYAAKRGEHGPICFCTDCVEYRDSVEDVDMDGWQKAFPNLPWEGKKGS